jgi:site-specific recombinase XerD
MSAEWPPLLRDFITYHESIKNHSKKTCNEYFLDLRHFFRFIKLHRGIAAPDTPLEEITIADVDKKFIADVTLGEVYAFLSYLSRERKNQPNSPRSEHGIGASARARKVACLRSFFKYLTMKVHVLEHNPVADLDSPRTKKALPKYLTLDQCRELLARIDGQSRERDTAILMIFIVCGLRISELAGINIEHMQDDTLRVLGKGNKDRIVYLNAPVIDAIHAYLNVRKPKPGGELRALFLSGQGNRMHVKTIHFIVKKHLKSIGLFDYSAHKLRHTAATLMISNGVNIKTVQEVLGHEHLNTTEIYTHISNDDKRRAAQCHPLS